MQFEARMGMRIFSDVAIDDFSLSPECFGLNIPQEHLQGYNYWDPRIFKHKIPHSDFVNKTGVNGVRAWDGTHFNLTMCTIFYSLGSH